MGRSPSDKNNGLKKGPWTEDEDLKLKQYIQIHGPGNWRTLPKNAGLQRCGKSCRLRWTNYLRPDIIRGRFSFEEEETIIQLHSVLGNKWSAIAARLPGRTDNEIKNYWNTHIRKRLIRNGIDPVTHNSRLDLLDLSSILNSAQFNLSNFLNLQTLVNPQVLRLATLLATSSNYNNHHLFLNNHITPMNQNPNQYIPNFTSTSSSPPSTHLLNQRDLMDENDGQYFSNNLANLNDHTSQEISRPACLTDVPNCGDLFNENNLPSGKKFNYDSVLSSPMSSPSPLISSSTFINSSSTEDERDSYCSNFFKLEIPESFEFDDLM